MAKEARVKVELFLDIPFTAVHRLNKARLRKKDIWIDGVNWPKMMVYYRDKPRRKAQ